MIKKHNASFGLNTNVHVDPAASANASPNITNHIYIRDFKRKVDDKQNLNFNASAVSENNVMNRDIKLDDDEEQQTTNDNTINDNTTNTSKAVTPGPSDHDNTINESQETHTTKTPVKKQKKIYAREVIITTETKNQQQVEEKPKTAEQVILETYAKILLDQNKALLLNLISKQTIIVPRTDLEEIIKAKTGLKCTVTLVDDESRCCIAKYSPIKKIETIKLIKPRSGEDKVHEELVSDFKQTRNNDYNDLINLYHLCLKFCIDY